MRSFILSLCFMLTISIPVQAHEFWIEPSTHSVENGELIRLHLKVGERFNGEAFKRNEQHMQDFQFKSATQQSPVLGFAQTDPAGLIRPKKDDDLLIGYLSRRQVATHAPSDFMAYLQEEGLPVPQQLKNSAITEAYWRCAKTHVTVGEKDTLSTAGHLSHPLEISSLEESNGILTGFHVDFEGQPLRNTRVVAVHQKQPQKKIELVTDDQGRINFSPTRRGRWMLTTIHMQPAPVAAKEDFQTYWASYTFEI